MKATIILFLACLFAATPIPAPAERMTDNWKLTGYTRYRDAVFADLARLSFPAYGTTAVWIKIAPSKRSQYLQSINEYLETMNKQNRGFRSIEILCEVNCTGHLIRFTKFVYLNGNRNIIHETYEAKPIWMQINQGSIWHPVEKAVCNGRK